MQVEIWSDVVCPWCAIGRARFQRALAQFEHADEVDVRWRSFELDPRRTGTIDTDYVTMLARKYRTTTDEAQAMVDRMTATGAAEGVEFRFDLARPGTTFDAHRLLHLAADRGIQDAVKARFLEATHGQGAAIADHEVLQRLATEAGLDGDEVADVLAGEAYGEDVRRDEEQAYEYGISGVPFFVLDGRVGIAGAQPSEHLLTALRQVHADGGAAAAATDATAARGHHAHAPGEACVDGVCAA